MNREWAINKLNQKRRRRTLQIITSGSVSGCEVVCRVSLVHSLRKPSLVQTQGTGLQTSRDDGRELKVDLMEVSVDVDGSIPVCLVSEMRKIESAYVH